MRIPSGIAALSILLALLAVSQAADETAAPKSDETYQLAYKFAPGETVRWEVMHRMTVKTTIQGTTQIASTKSESTKAWQVKETTPEGEVLFVHLVERVKMTNQLPNRAVVEYDSETDAEPPAGFGDVSKAVGVPLTSVRMDRHGRVLKREQHVIQPGGEQSDAAIALLLPSEGIPVGHVWSEPYNLKVQTNNGNAKQVQTRRRMQLKKVVEGVATIVVDYQVLTPLDDPAVESQIIQRLQAGEVRFDIEKGRVVSQQMDIDKRVLGFSGPTSSMHYLMRMTEELLGPSARVATKP